MIVGLLNAICQTPHGLGRYPLLDPGEQLVERPGDEGAERVPIHGKVTPLIARRAVDQVMTRRSDPNLGEERRV